MLVVIVLATVFIGVRTDPGARLLVRVGLHFADEVLAAKITVGRLHTNLWSGLELDDVLMRDTTGEEAASIEKLVVKFSLIPLTHSTLHVSSVNIIGGRARVHSLPDGTVNFAGLLKPSVPRPPRPDTPASKFRVEIDHVTAEVIGRYEAPPSVALPPIEGHVQVTGHVGIGGGDVKVGVDGLNVRLDKPGAVVVAAHGGLLVRRGLVTFDETEASIDAPGSLLHAFVPEPELRGRYHIDAAAKGPLTAFDLNAIIHTPSRPIKARGQLRIGGGFGWSGHIYTRNLDPELIIDGAPHALVWLDVGGKSDAEGATLAVAHAQVEAAHNKVHASGSVTIGKGITADGKLEIAATDLSKLKGRGIPKLAGNVSGVARVHYSPEGLVLDTDLTAQNLVVPGLRVRQASIRANTRNLSGSVVIKARDVYAGPLQLVDTRIQFKGTRKDFLLRVDSTGNDGTSLDLALHGIPRYEGGPFPVGVKAEVNALDLDRNGERWHVNRSAVLGYDGVVRVHNFHARSARQSISIDGTLDPANETVDADVHAVGLDLHRIVAILTKADNVPHSKLDLSVQAKGPLSHPIATVALAGTITRNAAKPEEQVHTRVEAHLDAKRLTARVELETAAGAIDVDAAVPFVTSLEGLLASTAPLSLKVDAHVKSLAQLYDTIGYKAPALLHPLESSIKLSLALSGTGRRPKLGLTLDGDGIHYGSMQNGQLRTKLAFEQNQLKTDIVLSLGTDTYINAQGKEVQQPSGVFELSGTLPVVLARVMRKGSLADKLGQNSPLSAQVKVKALELASLPLAPLGIPPLFEHGLLDGQLDVSGTVSEPVLYVGLGGKRIRRGKISRVGFNFGLRAQNRETNTALVLSIDHSTLLEMKAHATAGLAAVLAGADLKPTQLDASVDFPGFDMAKLAKLIPGMSGTLTGKAAAKGTFGDPTASAALSIDSFALGNTTMNHFAVDVGYSKGKLGASLLAREPAGGSINGVVEYFGKNLDASLEAKAFALDFESEGDAIPIRKLKGMLAINLSAKGPMPNPVVNGKFVLTKSTLAITADPREITDLGLTISIWPGHLKLDSLEGKLGPGRFTATGGAKLAGLVPQDLDVQIKTHQLPVLQNPINVAVDSQIDIHGEKKGKAINGTVKVTKGSARLPTLTNVRALQDTGPLTDVVYVDTKARRKAAKIAKQEAAVEAGTALDIDIETKIPGPFHIRSEELQVDMKGDLAIRVHGPDVAISGQVVALPGGRMEILGKRYTIDKIRVGFDGSPHIDPELDVKIARELDYAVIAIEVTGSASNPAVHLTSDPPIYSDSQIILAILGSDPGEQGSDAPLGDKVGGAVSGLVVGQIKNQLAPHLPIDVIKVDVGDSPTFNQTRLEVGKYIKNNVYVSYVHQFGQLLVGTRRLSGNIGNVEYRFLRNFALELSIGDAPEGKADLVWTLRY
ncbi:MAG: translocation/assembly module TamB domain-containing protein [Polyangia bacterium]